MRTFSIAGLGLMALALSGCGSQANTAAVSGMVKLDGKPVEKGAIQFIPVEGNTGPSAGGAINNGQYHIGRERGAAVGKNRVELRAFKRTGREVQDATKPAGNFTLEWVPALPPEYNDQSTVVREIKPGDNTFDFDIAVTAAGKR
jgi:hypothetical protein